MKKIVVNMDSREKRYAVLEDEQVVKIEIASPHQASKVGNMYLGKVTQVLPGMDAVFVDYGEAKHGFLHRDDLSAFQLASDKSGTINQYVREGEKLLVQVKRDETGTKGAKLSSLLELATTSFVYIVGIDTVGVSKKFKQAASQKYWRKLALQHKQPDEGFIIRTEMESKSEAEFVQTIETLRAQYGQIQQKAASLKRPGAVWQRDDFLETILVELTNADEGEIVIDAFSLYQEVNKWCKQHDSQWLVTYERGTQNIFSEQQIDVALAEALHKIVSLENGSYLVIEETEAGTVIDVNTGTFTGKAKKADTLLQTNLLAAKEVARQLRLRNLSGIVLVDFINMADPQHKQDVIKLMKKETAKDEMPVRVLGFTQLGIVEVTRKRTSPSLREKMMIACPVCNGSGIVASPETVAFRLERELMEHRRTDDEAVWVEMNQAVADVLLGEKESYRSILEEMIAKQLVVSIVQDVVNHYTIKRFGKYEELLEVSR